MKPSGESTGAPQQAETRLGWWLVALIFAVAAATRLAVATQLADAVLYRHPQLDAMEFLRWGRAIAGGDFRWPQYPTHGPAYPLLLGGLLALSDSLSWVRAFQAVLGASSCVLLGQVAARLFGRDAGAATGILVAVYGPLVYAETNIWEDGLSNLLLIGFLAIVVWGRPSITTAIGAGAMLGLTATVRPTPLILLPGLILLFFWPRRWPRPTRAAVAATLAALLLVTPAVIAASRAAGTFLFVRGFGSINLFIGNDPSGGGAQNARIGGAWDQLESAPFRDGVTGIGELEGYYTDKTVARIRDDPGGLIGVLASKLLWLTQAEELRDNHSYRFFTAQSSVLTRLPGYGSLLALAVAGLVVAWRRRAVPPILVLYVAAMAAVPVLTLMGLRYRLPIVPGLACFAGLGLASLVAAARKRHWREAGTLAVIALAIFGFSHLRHHAPTRNLAEEWVLSGSAHAKQGELEAAEAAFRAALDQDETSGIAWDGMGRIRFAQGRLDEARALFVRAIEHDPNLKRAHYHLGLVHNRQGRPDAAIAAFSRATTIAPRYLDALAELGPLLLTRGRLDDAEATFRQALVVAPTHRDSLVGLARLAGARSRPGDGIPFARRAVEARPEDAEAWMLLGFLAANRGDVATARDAVTGARSAGAAGDQFDLLRATAEHLAGEHAAAQAILRAVLQRNPRLQPAVQLLFSTADALGNRSEIVTFLNELAAR